MLDVDEGHVQAAIRSMHEPKSLYAPLAEDGEVTLAFSQNGVTVGTSNGVSPVGVYRVDATITDPNYTGETAARWRYVDGGGEVGMISSVTQAFCKDCTRARLSTEGKLYTCLFATRGHDLRALLREGRSDAEISGAVAQLWQARSDRYSELRTINTDGLSRTAGERKVEMSYIGG